MNRNQNILKTVINLTKKLKYEDILNGRLDINTNKISELTYIERSNVSRELNKLVTQTKLVKIKTNPVIFLDKEILEELLSIRFNKVVFNTIDDIINYNKDEKNLSDIDDPFSRVIGYNGSLDIPIKQAKAAVLYPPHGLHSLIVGATGTGKTTFAEIMYKYSISNNILSYDSAFIVFNCAEYSDNPQLLLSQLYGHVKGAFTGADKEKIGLIEKANNGIILLDEIHRLPPEGQEMLFLAMDKGLFRRMGETENYRTVNTIIIGATTEDTNSSLLQTFLRRIPILIRMPSLNERPLDERYRLIKSFFNEEFRNIKTPIKVYNEVLKALLLYDCRGNIGQLKSDIQLLCARGFLDFKTYSKKIVNIENALMPEHIYSGLLKLNESRDILYKVIDQENFHFEIFSQTNEERLTDIDDYKNKKDIYADISSKYNEYEMRGYTKKRIKEIIINDIENYFNSLFENFKSKNTSIDKEALFKILRPEVFKAVQLSVEFVEEKYNIVFTESIIVSLSMHISSLIDRISDDTNSEVIGLNNIVMNNNEYREMSKTIVEMIENELHIVIPREEINLITILLSTLDRNKSASKVGVLVIAHGDNTASSMADVANQLLSTDHCKAINMPLNEKVENILNKAINMVKSIDDGKGVLLLVDMGSLVTFSEIITKKTGIETKSMEMVSTPMVLEVLRKALHLEVCLNDIVNDFKLVNPYTSRISLDSSPINKEKWKKIITTCITGKGTALKIADFINESLPMLDQHRVKVESMSLEEYNQIDWNIESKHTRQIAALVGNFSPQNSIIPFISIEELIVGDGIKKIESLLTDVKYDNKFEPNNKNLYISILRETLAFLDPTKTYNSINKVLRELMNELDLSQDISFNIRFISHFGCMIERTIKGDSLVFNDIDNYIKLNYQKYDLIKRNIAIIEDEFGFEVCDTELGYIIDLVNTL